MATKKTPQPERVEAERGRPAPDRVPPLKTDDIPTRAGKRTDVRKSSREQE